MNDTIPETSKTESCEIKMSDKREKKEKKEKKEASADLFGDQVHDLIQSEKSAPKIDTSK